MSSVTCSKCKKKIEIDDLSSSPDFFRCRICGYTICGECGDWHELKASQCPCCGTSALWEKKQPVHA